MCTIKHKLAEYSKSAMYKMSVDVSELPKIYDGFKTFRNRGLSKKVRYIIKKKKPFLVNSKSIISVSGLSAIPVGIRKGIHVSPGGATRVLSGVLGKGSPRLSPDGQRAFNELAMAHEAIEIRSAKNLVGSRKINRLSDVDMFEDARHIYGKAKNIALQDSVSRKDRYFSPRRKPYVAQVNAQNMNKHVTPSEARYNSIFTPDIDKKGLTSHYSPDVLLQEGNIMATLSGKGGSEASGAMKAVRSRTGEADIINEAAKNLGYKNWGFGVNRINRKERKAFTEEILNIANKRRQEWD